MIFFKRRNNLYVHEVSRALSQSDAQCPVLRFCGVECMTDMHMHHNRGTVSVEAVTFKQGGSASPVVSQSSLKKKQ